MPIVYILDGNSENSLDKKWGKRKMGGGFLWGRHHLWVIRKDITHQKDKTIICFVKVLKLTILYTILNPNVLSLGLYKRKEKHLKTFIDYLRI